MGYIVCLGLNHNTAPLEVREKLAFSATALDAALARFGPMSCNGRLEGIAEAVILSTCNRLEIYALTNDPEQAFEALVHFLSDVRNVPSSAFADHLYQHKGEDATRHLMRVAAGLDSLVLGEPQILGQVVDAYQAAMTHGSAGTVLAALLRAAIHTGKRARTDTAISMNTASISSVAIQLAAEVFGDLSQCEVLITGAGEMGELAARALMNRGAKGILVANRTYSRAVQLAREWNGEAMTFERLGEGMARADIVISATDAPHHIVHVRDVEDILPTRAGRPLFIIDIAVPRDVEPQVGDLSGVHLYDVDDLQSIAEDGLEERRSEIPQVEKLIAQELDQFMAWLASLEVVPTINQLRRHAETIRQSELERALNKLEGLSDKDYEVVQMLSTRLVNKLLHDPITRLKTEAANGNGVVYTQTTRELFGL